jgi:hypothetical protein
VHLSHGHGNMAIWGRGHRALVQRAMVQRAMGQRAMVQRAIVQRAVGHVAAVGHSAEGSGP